MSLENTPEPAQSSRSPLRRRGKTFGKTSGGRSGKVVREMGMASMVRPLGRSV